MSTSLPIPIPSSISAPNDQTSDMEELSTSPNSFCTATGTPPANEVPLPDSPTLGSATSSTFPPNPVTSFTTGSISPTSQPVRLPHVRDMADPSDFVAAYEEEVRGTAGVKGQPTGPTQIQATLEQRQINRESHHLVRVHSHQQQVANNIKQPKRVSSVQGFGGHFSPPGTPENEADAREQARGYEVERRQSRRQSQSQSQSQTHVRRRSSIQDILSVMTSSPTAEGGRRRSIVSALLRKGSEEQVKPEEEVLPKVIHESSPASTMLATLPPRISSKRSTPNLGRPPFPSAQSSPVIPMQYAPFDPRYRPHAQVGRHAPLGPFNMNIHPPMVMTTGGISPSSPTSPHLSQSPHSPHGQYAFPMPPPQFPHRRPVPPAINVPQSSRSASPASRLSSPSTLSVRSSTPNLRSSLLGVKKEESVDTREKRVSTLNLPPMGFTNSVAPKFSRAGARRSGIVMPTPAYGSAGSRRPMSHLPSVSSLNTVDEMGTLGGGSGAGARFRHSHMPGQGLSATTSALEGGRPVYKRSSTTSLSSMQSGTSEVSASTSQRSVRPPEAGNNDKDTLETLLESASHSRQASADLPVPNAAFMRVRKGSAVSTDSNASAETSTESEAGTEEGTIASTFDAGASVPSLSAPSSTGSSNGHSSVPQTPDIEYATEAPVPLPPRVDSRPRLPHRSPSSSSPIRARVSAEEEDDAIEEVLAADDGYMRSLNARLQIDVQIQGTSRAASLSASNPSSLPISAFAPPLSAAENVGPVPRPHIVGSEDDDTELPYTRGSQSAEHADFDFGVLPSAPSMAHTIHPSPSFSRRFFGFGDKSVRGMSSFDSLNSVKSAQSQSTQGKSKMGVLASFGSMSSLRGRDKVVKSARGNGQMREVASAALDSDDVNEMSAPVSIPIPASASPGAGQTCRAAPNEKGKEMDKSASKGLKPKKSAVFLGKLGKAFGVKRKEGSVPPMPVPA